MPTLETHRAIDAVWRIESARLIAGLTRMVHDVGLAEELAQDALVAALEQWPESGVPDNPGAWLMAIAKRRAIDQFRRRETLDRKVTEIGRDLETQEPPDRRAGLRRDPQQHLRRPAAAGVHLLPPGPVHRGQGGAHAAAARRADHRGDRPRVPHPGADDRAADRAGQEDPRPEEDPVRGAGRERAGGAARLRARGRLPGLQRGLLGDRRRRLDAARAVRGRDAARPDPRRAGARRSRRHTG